ncbi:hypothetical protein PsorP6_013288 [Peronosclerospora sorghi]|uniref:Uncharacterized protein n=1 Tax=Peronosclerospora sorghi TaxID=230839 RepID=A0ACC0WGL6_9STRA|nr:hypothetical protein PsorP6_013288 [Peronosclerospora sorghi]
MQPSFPVFRTSKRRTKQGATRGASEVVAEPRPLFSPRTSSEVHVFDDKVTRETGRTDRPKRCGSRRMMLQAQSAWTRRRRQFLSWKDQTTTKAATALQGCYKLARRFEVASWKRRRKPEVPHDDLFAGETTLRSCQRVPSGTKSSCQTASHPTRTRTSVVSAINALLTSTHAFEDDERGQASSQRAIMVSRRRTHRSTSLELKANDCSHAQTATCSPERLFHTLPLTKREKKEEMDAFFLSTHLPFRKTTLYGQEHVIANNWI